ncbi:extracellular solute-binding protein [Streptomyces gibsoniae]|uniref:Extracellular solute-binding protein n=1 Tax=Streptomyces gibsoniae TaxID=3075529 RepID=A0ABU2U9Q1_9ACTN|nr:extracellular solute-binding protein [Streptomyces sp. DSM 41699]MDT0469973.1 extracellular solute-binding protein [Streptomyces sp. DSM 41699]
MIDPNEPLPVYVQLKNLLIQEIVDGRYGPGDRLPTEQELCAVHHISRTPVNRALTELAEEGVVLRQRRHGSFVNPGWIPPNTAASTLKVVVPEGSWEATVRAAAPPELSLDIVQVGLSDLRQVLVRAVAEGRAPDLAIMDSVWVHEFAASGFLAPLEDLDSDWVLDEYEADFLEPFRSANRFDGRPVAVQAEADVAGIWYRRSDLAAVGHQPPRTWDELAALGRVLAQHGSAIPLTLPGGPLAGETATYCLLSLLASNGAGVLRHDAVTLDTAAATESLAFLRELLHIGVISAESVSYERHVPIHQLAQGHASMAIGGSYDAPALAAAASLTTEQLLDQFGFIAMPTGPRGHAATLAGGMVYGIFRQAASPKLSMRLLRTVTSVEALTRMSKDTWQLAPRRTALQDAAQQSPFLHTTATMLQQAVVRPSTPPYARVSAQLHALLESVLLGRREPQAAAARTADMISAITGLPVA